MVELNLPEHGFSPDQVKHLGPQIFPEDRRFRIVYLSVQEFARLLLGCQVSSDHMEMHVVTLSGLPDDAKFVEFRFDWFTNCVYLIMWSSKWGILSPYETMPRATGISIVERTFRMLPNRTWYEVEGGFSSEFVAADKTEASPSQEPDSGSEDKIGEPLVGYAKHKWEKYLE